MPWDVKKGDSRCNSGEFAVVKRDDNELEGCHSSRAKANKQLAALNAAESKGVGMGQELELEQEEKAIPIAEIVTSSVPDGVTSFAELDRAQSAQVKARKTEMLSDEFQQIVINIMASDEIVDKAGAVSAQANEFGVRHSVAMAQKEKWQPLTDKVIEVKDKIVEKLTKDEPEPESSNFTVWKEADTYRWLAIYSNNYRDDDRPAEIISAEAHKDFVKAVDEGEWPYPELWFWHVKGTKFGVSDLVTFDEETGHAVASGTIDKGKEALAEKIMERDDFLTSHGMPSNEIVRDETDPTIITRYRTKEISPLPAKAAANKYTGISLKEDTMIPANKRAELEGLGFNVDELEAQMSASSQAAESEGRESKEIESATETVEPITEIKAEEGVIEVSKPIEPIVQLDPADFAAAIGNTINDAIAPLIARIDALESVEKEKEIEPVAPVTPIESFASILRSRVIGAESANVDGRTKEAKDGPVENQGELPQIITSNNPLTNSIVSRLVSGQTFKELGELQGRRQ